MPDSKPCVGCNCAICTYCDFNKIERYGNPALEKEANVCP